MLTVSNILHLSMLLFLHLENGDNKGLVTTPPRGHEN